MPPCEGDVVLKTTPFNPHFKAFGERIDHRNTHTMQATGELVAFVGELAARVQLGQDDFDTRFLLLWVDINRHPTTIIGHL